LDNFQEKGIELDRL